MSDPRIRLVLPEPEPLGDRPRPLGRMLVEAGHVSASDLLATLGSQKTADARLGELLVARGLIAEDVVYRTLAAQYHAQFVGYSEAPPDLTLQKSLNPLDMLRLKSVPWSRVGNITCIACADPARFSDVQDALPPSMFPVLLVVASRGDIERAIHAASGARLATQAEIKVPARMSCRNMPNVLAPLLTCAAVALTAGLLAGWISWTGLYSAIFLFATCMVFVGMFMKCTGAVLHLVARSSIFARPGALPDKLPRVSILVPLLGETKVLPELLSRLTLLRYPKELLDVLLVLENDDSALQSHLAELDLPDWMRMIVVPAGQIKTKPRAMNYALPFCAGSIVGIYDAEDSPHPNQIHDVVAAFEGQPEQTACIQAVLDFYNARSNAMSRFFAVEYAAWFRLILPGVARLGFAIPLGGTSVFFRRTALEHLHGWDAYNVTEDADLGIRLARAGYRTALIPSVTLEEANNRVWPWVRQRSRWLKGYLITYLSHMRNPWTLLVELGPWKFLGFQAFFLSAISQYMLAPLIWSSMIMYFGAPHFIQTALPPDTVQLIMIAFAATWVGSTAVYIVAISGRSHRHLIPWTFGMSIYLGLGTLAIYKGIFQMLKNPFYWDKTEHGVTAPMQPFRSRRSAIIDRRIKFKARHKGD